MNERRCFIVKEYPDLRAMEVEYEDKIAEYRRDLEAIEKERSEYHKTWWAAFDKAIIEKGLVSKEDMQANPTHAIIKTGHFIIMKRDENFNKAIEFAKELFS